jgi:hypothetical protein
MNASADDFFSEYINNFLTGNGAARKLAESLKTSGVGLMPLVDHCTLRTLDVDKRALEANDLGFQYDGAIGVLEFDKWWAKVYRKPGYPSLFIDQAFSGERGQGSLIPGWVKAHGDQCFHHIAILVEDIELAMTTLKTQNIQFSGNIVGERGTDLRQIFTQPEMRNGEVYSVLELIERHNGYAGFLPPQADGLMESTRR